MLPTLLHARALALFLCLLTLGAAAQEAQRPRIGLVLSGGGARGLAHVGVLKVLERERVPIDFIAGTSMGAIIGGLYASGMSAAEIERELLKVDWDAVFASRVDRQQLSQRRKEEDFEIAPLIEFGMRDGELRAPLGALSGRGLESLLRRYTLPARAIERFDALPIPFRAVATDMETGQPLVLERGDLALALRSSMSVPGVFAPTDVGGRVLGDGGLVDNLPVGVARKMGADIIIAVNIGTPLAPRDTLSSVSGLTAQMINILTEQNVRSSIATLMPRDVLISPALGSLTSADFNRTAEFISLGEGGALPLVPRLAALSLDAPAYAAWRSQHPRAVAPAVRIARIGFAGTEVTNPQRLAPQLESSVGQAFDPAAAERDARRLAASGDYTRTDFKIVGEPEGEALIFDLEDKPWGPNYFRIGLDMSTDFRGGSSFNIKVSHNRHWLDAGGTEWRNQVQIGQVPRVFTELYHPLGWSSALGKDWFVAGYAGAERREASVYENNSGSELGRFKLSGASFGADLGQPWGAFGELRIGASHVIVRAAPDILASSFNGLRQGITVNETGLRLGAVVDQLDFANFPQRGYRAEAEAVIGSRTTSLTGNAHSSFTRLEFQGTAVASFGIHTVNAYLRAQRAGSSDQAGVGRYTLGGFHQLSGYRNGQLDGNEVLFGRLTYYQRLPRAPLFTRGLFAGGTLEAGNAWAGQGKISLGDLRVGSSLFVGADTGLGPLYLGVTYAPRGAAGLYLFLGRP